MAKHDLLHFVKQRNAHESEFIQAVEEVALSLTPVLDKHPEFQRLRIFERITEPERLISFRVT